MISTADGMSSEASVRLPDISESGVTTTAGKASGKTIMVVVKGRLFRDGIQKVLQNADRIVVGDCETVSQLSEWLDSSPAPDLFVVQIEGTELAAETFADIRKVRAAVPDAKWLVLSQRTDLTFLRAAVQSGVDGLLLEDSPGEVLQHLAELVLLGYSFVPSELARILSDGAAANSLDPAPLKSPAFRGYGNESWGELKAPLSPRAGGEPTESSSEAIETAASVTNGLLRRQQVNLSDRENEILRCLVSGHSNKMIARELQIAEATVKVHVKGLLRKMQVSNRTQAAICALNHMHAPIETGVKTTPSEPMTWASPAASVMNRAAGPIDARVHAAAR